MYICVGCQNFVLTNLFFLDRLESRVYKFVAQILLFLVEIVFIVKFDGKLFCTNRLVDFLVKKLFLKYSEMVRQKKIFIELSLQLFLSVFTLFVMPKNRLCGNTHLKIKTKTNMKI